MSLQVGQLPIKPGWQNVSLVFDNLAKPFTQYYIFNLNFLKPSNSNNDSLLLLFDYLWKVRVEYMVQKEKHNIFILTI